MKLIEKNISIDELKQMSGNYKNNAVTKAMIHTGLTHERWFKLSIFEQFANIGMDIERTIQWKNKNSEYSRQAFERALELLDLTIADPKNKKRLKEICRVRYLLIDYFMYDNEYLSTDESWQNYFYAFNYAAALQRGR